MPSLRSILENERSIHENEHSAFPFPNTSASSLAESFFADDSRILDSPASQPSYCSQIDKNSTGQQQSTQTPGTDCRDIGKEMLSPPSAISLFQPNRPEKQVLRWDETSNAAPATRPPKIANRASGDSFSSFGNDDSFSSNSGRNLTPPQMTTRTRGGGILQQGLPVSGGRRSIRSLQRVLALDTRPTMAVRLPSMTSVVASSYDSLPSFEGI
jgi:hypothetical protein